jgi:hypothetical protein
MSHVLHVFKKDVRRLRWAVVAWVAAVIARLILNTTGAELSFGAVGPQIAIANLSDLLLIVELLLLALIVSGLVHDEPLVGADAFWLTRPIGANALLAAKLSFAALFLVAAPMAGQSIVAAAVSGDPRVAGQAALAFAFSQTLWISFLVAVAAVTPSLVRFLLTLVGGVAAMAVAVSLVLTTVLLTGFLDESGYTESSLMDGTSGVVWMLLATCAILLAVAYQYRHRRAGRAVAIGVVCVIAAAFIADRFPWRFGLPPEPDPGAWARDAALSPAVVDAGVESRASQDELEMGRAVSHKYVAAPLRLAGVPPDSSADRIATKTRVEYPDGTRLESAQARDVSFPLPGSALSGRTARFRSALGDTRLLRLNPDEVRWSTWPALLSVTDQEYERYGQVPGRLTAMVHFFIYRSRLVGAMLLAPRASLRDNGSQFEVRRVLRRPDRCTVLVRRIGGESLSRPSEPKQYEFVLRNAARGEAVQGQTRQLTAPGPRVATTLTSMLIPRSGSGGWGIEGSALGFDFVDTVAEFPPRVGPSSIPSPIDAAWLDGAELVVIETAYAGRVTRTIAVDDFRMR